MSEWTQWGIRAELMAEAIRRLPDEWSITIELNGSNARPYVILRDPNGDCVMDGDGPNEGESVIGCLRRLMLAAEREAGEEA